MDPSASHPTITVRPCLWWIKKAASTEPLRTISHQIAFDLEKVPEHWGIEEMLMVTKEDITNLTPSPALAIDSLAIEFGHLVRC